MTADGSRASSYSLLLACFWAPSLPRSSTEPAPSTGRELPKGERLSRHSQPPGLAEQRKDDYGDDQARASRATRACLHHLFTRRAAYPAGWLVGSGSRKHKILARKKVLQAKEHTSFMQTKPVPPRVAIPQCNERCVL